MLQSKPDSSDELGWVRSNEGSSRWHSQHASTRHHANHFLSIMFLWGNWNPERWNDEGRGAALLPSGSCSVRCASPLLQVKWRSLANKPGEALLPEGSHAFQPIPGWDVLKQHMSISLHRQVQKPVKTCSRLFSPRWGRNPGFSLSLDSGVGSRGLWWLLGLLTPDCMCTVYVRLRAHSLIHSLKWGYSVENKD